MIAAARPGTASYTIDRVSSVAASIEHAAHLLPAQGPISIFIHHNTLHAFEDLPFETAVERAAVTFGAEPFLAEARYRDKLAAGRILAADVDAVLTDELKDRAALQIADAGTRSGRSSICRTIPAHPRSASSSAVTYASSSSSPTPRAWKEWAVDSSALRSASRSSAARRGRLRAHGPASRANDVA